MRASKRKEAVLDALSSAFKTHEGGAVTFPHLYEWVFDRVDFVPSENDVRWAIGSLVADGDHYFKVARDVYAWAPDGNPPPPPAPPRVATMIELRRAGKTLDEVGQEFGVTRERVRQLMTKHGGPDAAEVRQVQAERERAAELAHAASLDAAIRSVLGAAGPQTVEDVAAQTGIGNADVARFWPRDLAHLKLWGVSNAESRWSDDDILDAIKEASAYEFPLTTSAYRDLVAVGQIKGPSLPRIGQRYGSWTAACQAAGVTAGRTMRNNYESRWSDQDLLDIIRQYLLDPAAPNSANRFDQWKRDNVSDGPSFQTIRNRFGSWTEAKRRALTSMESGT